MSNEDKTEQDKVTESIESIKAKLMKEVEDIQKYIKETTDKDELTIAQGAFVNRMRRIEEIVKNEKATKRNEIARMIREDF